MALPEVYAHKERCNTVSERDRTVFLYFHCLHAHKFLLFVRALIGRGRLSKAALN